MTHMARAMLPFRYGAREHGLAAALLSQVVGTDDEPFGGPPPDPSLRSWRHPSEVAAAARAAAQDEAQPNSGFSIRTFALGGVAGVAVCVGLLMFTSVASLGPTAIDTSGQASTAITPPATVSTANPASADPAQGGTSSDDGRVADQHLDAMTASGAGTGTAEGLEPTTTLLNAATTTAFNSAGIQPGTLADGSPTTSFDPATYGADLPTGVYAVTSNGELIAHAASVDGVLITSARATSQAGNLSILVDGETMAVTPGASDRYTDIALLALDQATVALTPVIEFDQASNGDHVLVGLAPGEIVSTGFRTVGADGHPVIGALLTTIRSNRGDAGSVLENDDGAAVGFIVGCESMLTVALPFDTARTIANDLAAFGSPRSAWLGIETVVEANGLRLTSVQAGAPASMAGLQEDDVIISVNNAPLHDIADLVETLRAPQSDTTLSVEILRGTALIETLVEISVQP